MAKESSSEPVSSPDLESSTRALSPASTNKCMAACRLSERMKLALLFLYGFAFAGALQGHLGLTMLFMVKPIIPTAVSNASVPDVYICPKNGLELQSNLSAMNSTNSTNVTLPAMPEAEFEWDSGTQGLILSSFYAGSLIARSIGGPLARIWGPKKVIGISLFIAGVLTVVTPFIVRLYGSLAMIGLRFATGAATDMIRPVYLAMWAKWAPEFERTKLVTISFQGTVLSGVLTTMSVGTLTQMFGWSSVFYLFGGYTILWVLAWLYTAYDTPSQHPRILMNERMFIEGSIGNDASLKAIPWASMLTSPAVLALILIGMTSAWAFVTVNTIGPLYMSLVFQISPLQIGLIPAGLAGCSIITAIVFSILSDIIRKRKTLTTVTTRKLLVAIGTMSVVFSITYAHLDCRQVNIYLALLFLSGIFASIATVSVKVNPLDIAPQFASIIAGISDTLENVIAIAAPIVTSYIVRDSMTAQWRQVFYINGGIIVFGNIVYLAFAKGHVLPWAKPDGVETKANETTDNQKQDEDLNQHGDPKPSAHPVETTHAEINEGFNGTESGTTNQMNNDHRTSPNDKTEITDEAEIEHPGDDDETGKENNPPCTENDQPREDAAEVKVNDDNKKENIIEEEPKTDPSVKLTTVVDSLLAIKS